MQTFMANEAAPTHVNRQTAGAGDRAQREKASTAATADISAAALTLQRFRKMANNSHQALQLKQQAELVATSPEATTLQRFQQMANTSPRAHQLKQQAEMVAARTSQTSQRPMPSQIGMTTQRVTDEDVLQGRFANEPRKQGPGIVQRIVDVGGTIYKAYGKKGCNPYGLVRDVRKRADEQDITLKRGGWQDVLRDEARDTDPANTKFYASLDEIIDKVKSEAKSDKRKRELEEQDENIKALLSGVREPTKEKARIIAYESSKAMKSVRKHMLGTDEYTKTKAELEALKPAEIGAKNEVEATKNSAYVFEALVQSDKMQRLDFNFHDTPIVTHGYESMGDRTKDASTLNPFALGPVKIGKDIGSYRRARKRGTSIRGPSNRVLTNLEMVRIPETSAMLGTKRDLYEKDEIELEEAIAADSLKSNVEFLGAVKGSGLLADQKSRMQQQQILSNAHTLEDYAARFPDHEIGTETKDLKARTTPKKIKGSLEELEKAKDTPSKKAFRKTLKRAIASSMDIDDYQSNSDVSDFDESHYE